MIEKPRPGTGKTGVAGKEEGKRPGSAAFTKSPLGPDRLSAGPISAPSAYARSCAESVLRAHVEEVVMRGICGSGGQDVSFEDALGNELVPLMEIPGPAVPGGKALEAVRTVDASNPSIRVLLRDVVDYSDYCEVRDAARQALASAIEQPPRASPASVLQRHLVDMDAVVEFCRAAGDDLWRGDYEETRRRAMDILPKNEVLAAVRSSDPADPEIRDLLVAVARRSEHSEVREAASRALSGA